MFKFKAPSNQTLEIMSEVAKGNVKKDYEESCINKIKDLTSKEHVKITSSGNNSIFIDCGLGRGGRLGCLRLEDGKEFYV